AIAEFSPEARPASDPRPKEPARIPAEEAVVAAAAAKAKAEADAVPAAEARRNAFGAETVASRGAARFEPGPGEVRTIESTISETFKNSTGFSVFLLENGQLWREVDIPTPINARVGDKVIVEKTALGGYKLNFVRINRAILVKRLK
ncbi:MAG: hypothetical protein H7268_04065, partial [Sandarakinorhabdus sp.]|nr:hypothetical protein [Sandarakinorhabdus sp.]